MTFRDKAGGRSCVLFSFLDFCDTAYIHVSTEGLFVLAPFSFLRLILFDVVRWRFLNLADGYNNTINSTVQLEIDRRKGRFQAVLIQFFSC